MGKISIPAFLLFGILCCIATHQNIVKTGSGGTILMFYNEPDRAFVAADSRFYDGRFPNARNNSGCKIISLSDKNFFFYSGGIAEVKTTLDNHVLVSANILARKAFQETSLQSDPYFRLHETARHWAVLMKPVADALLRVTPQNQTLGEVQLGGFGGLDSSGAPKMVLVNMTVTIFNDGRPSISGYEISEWPDRPSTLQGFGGIAAAIDNANEFLDGATSRAKQANMAFENSFRNKPIKDHDNFFWAAAIETAVRWTSSDPRVGGRVDAVVLERGRALRWIQRKQNCYQEDVTH